MNEQARKQPVQLYCVGGSCRCRICGNWHNKNSSNGHNHLVIPSIINAQHAMEYFEHQIDQLSISIIARESFDHSIRVLRRALRLPEPKIFVCSESFRIECGGSDELEKKTIENEARIMLGDSFDYNPNDVTKDKAMAEIDKISNLFKWSVMMSKKESLYYQKLILDLPKGLLLK